MQSQDLQNKNVKGYDVLGGIYRRREGRTRLHVGVTAEKGGLERGGVVFLLIPLVADDAFPEILASVLCDVCAWSHQPR